MSAHPHASTPPQDPTQDQVAPPGSSCVVCEYALDGLTIDAVCPECSRPVRDALDPSLLRFADERTLSQAGKAAAAFRVMLGLLLTCVLGLASIVVGRGAGLTPWFAQGYLLSAAMLGVAWSLGWWWTADAARHRMSTDRQIRPRIVVGLAGLLTVLTLLSIKIWTGWIMPRALMTILAGATGIAAAGTIDRGIELMASLVRGFPDAALAERVRRCKRWMFAVFLLGTIGSAVMFVVSRHHPPAGSIGFVIIGTACAIQIGLCVDALLRCCSGIDRERRRRQNRPMVR